MKQIIDANLQKLISRKLLVWLTSTGLLMSGLVNSEQWVALSLAYVGIQGFADIATKWKNSN